MPQWLQGSVRIHVIHHAPHLNGTKIHMSASLVGALVLMSAMPAVVGYFLRQSIPRTALFLLGLPVALVGLWLILMLLEDSQKNVAPRLPVRYRSLLRLFGASEPSEGWFWLYLVCGGLVLVIGVVAMVLPFTPRGARIKFDR